jgi:hypothetical protein
MNPSDVMKYGDKFLMSQLEGIPDPEWETGGVCGWWSVKNIISHLASYEIWLGEILASFGEGAGATPCMDQIANEGINNFSAANVESRKNKAPKDVLNEYHEAHKNAMELAAKINTETWRQNGTLPWYGAEYSLEDFIVYQYYGHKREHGAQIAVFKDKLREKH